MGWFLIGKAFFCLISLIRLGHLSELEKDLEIRYRHNPQWIFWAYPFTMTCP